MPDSKNIFRQRVEFEDESGVTFEAKRMWLYIESDDRIKCVTETITNTHLNSREDVDFKDVPNKALDWFLDARNTEIRETKNKLDNLRSARDKLQAGTTNNE